MPAAFTTKIKKFKKKSKRQALGYDATNTPNINVFGVEKRRHIRIPFKSPETLESRNGTQPTAITSCFTE